MAEFQRSGLPKRSYRGRILRFVAGMVWIALLSSFKYEVTICGTKPPDPLVERESTTSLALKHQVRIARVLDVMPSVDWNADIIGVEVHGRLAVMLRLISSFAKKIR